MLDMVVTAARMFFGSCWNMETWGLGVENMGVAGAELTAAWGCLGVVCDALVTAERPDELECLLSTESLEALLASLLLVFLLFTEL